MDGSVFISAGSIIAILIAIVGFFVSRLFHDLKKVIEETGKNKGRIDLINAQLTNDVKRIEERTASELKTLTNNVNVLSENVNALVLCLAQKGVKIENKK